MAKQSIVNRKKILQIPVTEVSSKAIRLLGVMEEKTQERLLEDMLRTYVATQYGPEFVEPFCNRIDQSEDIISLTRKMEERAKERKIIPEEAKA